MSDFTLLAINPVNWYGDREVKVLPKHFILASTLLTEESKFWVLNNLSGRFCVIPFLGFHSNDSLGKIAFENPNEITLYELRWS